MSSPGELKLEWWPPGTVPPPASIVWCNFPHDLAPDRPGPYARPALVFKVRHADYPPADRFNVLVAYGTSVLKSDTRLFDFTISNWATLNLIRLPQATRFDLDRVVWLPWARPFFVPRDEGVPYASPTISTLPAELQRMLGWTMAERDARGLNEAYRRASDTPPANS